MRRLLARLLIAALLVGSVHAQDLAPLGTIPPRPTGNQGVGTTDSPTFVAVDTGQGANELYDMDQNVLTTSRPTFAGLDLTDSVAFTSADLGATLVTNGTFTGSATGWTLGAGWAYGANAVTHTPGSTATLSQDPLGGGALIEGRWYKLLIPQTAGTDGEVVAVIGGVEVQTIDGSDGAITEPRFFQAETTAGLILTPDTDYDGTLDNISVQLVPEYLALSYYLPYANTGTQRFQWTAKVDAEGNGYAVLQTGNDAGDTWTDVFKVDGAPIGVLTVSNDDDNWVARLHAQADTDAVFHAHATGTGASRLRLRTNDDANGFDLELSAAGNVIFEDASSYTFDGGDVILDNQALKTNTTTAETLTFQAYDVNGTAYLTFATLTNGDTPSFAIAPPVGGTVSLTANVIQPPTPETYTVTNVTTDRDYDANAASTDILADVLGTLIADLRAIGLVD